MALLLDTHAALWCALGDQKLSAVARAAIEGENQQRNVSAASYWEIAIKVCLGRFTLTVPFGNFWNDAFNRCGYAVLPIEIRHADRVSNLPRLHGDPFDRMLVAQALCEQLPIVSNDSRLDDYGVQRIW